MKTINELIQFLNKLENHKIYYELKKIREDSILVFVIVPGEKWEIEFMNDGSIEIERFKSDGTMFDKNELEILFKNYSD